MRYANKSILLRAGILSAVTLGTITCGQDNANHGGTPIDQIDGQTGLQLTTDILSTTDVVGFEVQIVSCVGVSTYQQRATIALKDMVAPAGTKFPTTGLNAQSGHLFADHFLTLPPGCYNVTVRPLSNISQPYPSSTQCRTAAANNVVVAPNKTTEVLLLSQCDGTISVGGLGTVAGINHAPEIRWAAYLPSKFVCEESTVDLCVGAYDPDNDPMEFSFGSSLSFDVLPIQQVTLPVHDAGETVRCWRLRTAVGQAGDQTWVLKLYDLMVDGSRIEDFLKANRPAGQQVADPGATSQDSLSGPFHVVAKANCIPPPPPPAATPPKP